MRKWNAWISLSLIILLLIHGAAGGFQMIGGVQGGNNCLKALSWLMAALICLHIGIGAKLTMDTFRLYKKTGTSYFKENSMFWIRRISGFALIMLVAFHVYVFMGAGGEAFRLRLFAWPELTGSLLLAATLIVHVLTNVKPLLIAFGAKGMKEFSRDILLILAIVLLFCSVAFVIYYLRWNIFWKL
jgi:hypothetical protein